MAMSYVNGRWKVCTQNVRIRKDNNDDDDDNNNNHSMMMMMMMGKSNTVK